MLISVIWSNVLYLKKEVVVRQICSMWYFLKEKKNVPWGL